MLQRSGLLELENTLGNQIVQAKHEILGRTVASECSEMIKQSHKIVQQRLNNLRAQITELHGLRGKNDDDSKGLLAKWSLIENATNRRFLLLITRVTRSIILAKKYCAT